MANEKCQSRGKAVTGVSYKIRDHLTSQDQFEFRDPAPCLLDEVGGEKGFWVEQSYDIIFPNQEMEAQSLRMTDQSYITVHDKRYSSETILSM